MKKLFIVLFSILLLLCSCENSLPGETSAGTAAVTADTEILFSAAGFETVYDESLGATWVCRPEIESGLFARILVYDGGQASLRIVCTDAGSFEYNGKTYEITGGDVFADKDMTRALKDAAVSGDCRIGERNITDEERSALSAVISLYEASYGAPYAYETKSGGSASEEEENGYKVYTCEGFSIKYPDSFSASKDGDVLIITSGAKKPLTVSIKHTDTDFSPVIADKDAVLKNITEQGGELTSDVEKISIDGKAAYTFSYVKDGIYITQYFADGGKGTYIITAGTYEKGDQLPESIVSSLKIK